MPWILWNQIDADPHLGHHGKLDFDRCYGMRLTQIPTENHRLRRVLQAYPNVKQSESMPRNQHLESLISARAVLPDRIPRFKFDPCARAPRLRIYI